MTTEQAAETICLVCHDHLAAADIRTIGYGCGHRFHSNCILEWVLRDNFECPACRAKVIDAERGLYRPGLEERLNSALTTLDSLARLIIMFLASTVATGLMTVATTVMVFVRVLGSLAVMGLTTVLLAWLAAVLYSWLFRLSLTGGSRICFHTRSIFPLVELHVSGLVHLLGHPGHGTDALTLIVFAVARNTLLFVLETVSFILDNELICGS